LRRVIALLDENNGLGGHGCEKAVRVAEFAVETLLFLKGGHGPLRVSERVEKRALAAERIG
jgi:hypothetical protein